MRNGRRSVLVGVMASVVLLASCHGAFVHGSTVKWVNQSDTRQSLEFCFQELTILGQVHAAVYPTKLKAIYIFRNGDESSEGTLKQEGSDYILVSKDGGEQRLHTESPSTLKDDSGTTWNLDNPRDLVMLRKL